jgi:lysophospholipase L1-like esterase
MRFGKILVGLVSSAMVGILLFAGSPAASAAPPSTYYLALGDSLSQGYMPGVGNTNSGYVDDLYRVLAARQPGLQLVKLGCSGETTTSMRSGGVCAYPGAGSQLTAAEAFLRSHPGQVSELTIDIGANDIDRCATGQVIDPTCVTQGLRTLAGNLFAILAGLRQAGGPVPVVAMTYYDPYLAAWLTGATGQQTAVESVLLTDALNAIEATEYALFAARIADVSAAFRTNDFTHSAGELPINVATICQLTYMCTVDNIHPNSAGYQLIADTFAAVG